MTIITGAVTYVRNDLQSLQLVIYGATILPV